MIPFILLLEMSGTFVLRVGVMKAFPTVEYSLMVVYERVHCHPDFAIPIHTVVFISQIDSIG